jgi:hypothetical protein
MPEVRRRRTTKAAAPVSRRRDRAVADEEAEETEEEEAEETPRPARRSTKATKKATTVKKRTRPAPEPEPEEEEPEDEEAEDEEDWDEEAEDEEEPEAEDEEEEEEPPPPPRRKKAAATKKAARRRPEPEPEEDEYEDEDEEEEEEPPRRAKKAAAKKTTVRRKPKSAEGLPLGVRAGNEGAEATTRSGGGATRLKLEEAPQLIKVLENKVLLSFRQHWVPQGGGQPDRPYVCIGDDCPLCEMGDQSSGSFVFNVLDLSDPTGPTNKILQVGVKAYKSWKSAATGRDEKIHYDKDFWAVNRSGKGQQSQTNFRPLKLRDLEEDWEELADLFDFDELDDIIADAKEDMYDTSIIPGNTRAQLREVAKYFAEE